jgi:hypothetical protein
MRCYLCLRSVALVAICLRLCPGITRSVSFNRVDDFEDGTTMQWTGNIRGTVESMVTGGPGRA